MSKMDVVGLGALNMDYLYRVERILDDGETVVKDFKQSPGGSAANTIYGLARLGVKTGFAGMVGDDSDGEILIKDFQKAGVDTSQIKVKHRVKSGSVICLTDSLGHRSLYVLPAANSRLTINDLDVDYVNQARILHISSFADDRQFKVTRDLMRRLNSSVKLSFAPGALYASHGLKALAPILSRTYVLFLNENEIQQLTGQGVRSGAKTCLEPGCRIVAVTLGQGKKLRIGKGVAQRTVTAIGYIRDAKNEYVIEPPERSATQVDTTGAGDAFAAGFLYGLLKNKGLEVCGRLGNIVAQFSIREVGARAGLPTLAQLSRRYQELYREAL
jgi:ribokinase